MKERIMKSKTTVKMMNNKNKKQKKKQLEPHSVKTVMCGPPWEWEVNISRQKKKKKTLVDFFLENHPSYSFDRDRQGKTRWWLSRGNRSKTHQAPSHEDVFYFFFS